MLMLIQQTINLRGGTPVHIVGGQLTHSGDIRLTLSQESEAVLSSLTGFPVAAVYLLCDESEDCTLIAERRDAAELTAVADYEGAAHCFLFENKKEGYWLFRMMESVMLASSH